MRKFLKITFILITFHLLMSTDCSGFDREPVTYKENPVKISFDNSSNFSINDTIAINGWVSVNAYDEQLKDSVKLPYNIAMKMFVEKFVNNTNYNLKRSRNSFNYSSQNYTVYEDMSCPNTEILLSSKEDTSSNLFRFELKVVPKETGDFLLSFDKNTLFENTANRHSILSQYPISNSNNNLISEKCIPEGDVYKTNISGSQIIIRID